MWSDPVVEATRQARAEVVAPFKENIHSFFEFIRERERKSSEPAVTLPPNPAEVLTGREASR
jgi:hypothetical protein